MIICTLLILLLGLAVGATVFYVTSMAEDEKQDNATSMEENLLKQLKTVPSELENSEE